MSGKIFCGECRDFLYESTDGYGICARDNDLHSCGERCIYSDRKEPTKIN